MRKFVVVVLCGCCAAPLPNNATTAETTALDAATAVLAATGQAPVAQPVHVGDDVWTVGDDHSCLLVVGR